MNPNTFPTKGNLILAKNSLALAKQGYVLMDKKRNILIRELMDLIDQARDIQSEIDSTFREAYESLQKANIELGINYVQEISSSIPIENGIRIKARSIMGTEIPLVQHEEAPINPTYAYYNTRESLDDARVKFDKVKEPRPHTKITPAMIRFLDLVRSTLFSTTLRTPMAEIIPYSMKLTPPIMEEGMVLMIADTFGIKLTMIANTAAIRITLGSCTRLSSRTPVFSP